MFVLIIMNEPITACRFLKVEGSCMRVFNVLRAMEGEAECGTAKTKARIEAKARWRTLRQCQGQRQNKTLSYT